MKESRLNALLKHLENDQDDSFILYAVALEYKSIDKKKSIIYFEKLMKHHPEYLPSYYQLGLVYYELNKNENAKLILTKGIEIAKNTAEHKTLKELKSLYDEIIFEDK